MSIKFACNCGKAYKVPDKFSGKRVKCKQCGDPIRVPSESQPSVNSARASAVSKRSVLKSQRVSKRSARVSGRQSSRSGRQSSRSGRRSRRTRKASSGSKTERVKAVELAEGNELKRYQKKKEEEFRHGEGRLTYFENGKAVKAFRVNKGDTVVGRNDGCGVQIPDASVSNEHMKLEYKLGTFISTDLQSKNGVVINGRQMRRSSLKSGDVLQLGSAILRFDC